MIFDESKIKELKDSTEKNNSLEDFEKPKNLQTHHKQITQSTAIGLTDLNGRTPKDDEAPKV